MRCNYSQRERGLSIVTANLPNTVKLLIASLDKTSTQLVIKYTNRQHASGGGGGSGSLSRSGSSTSSGSRRKSSLGGLSSEALAGGDKSRVAGDSIDELDLFVDSLGVIVDRLRTRIQARPDKVCHSNLIDYVVPSVVYCGYETHRLHVSF